MELNPGMYKTIIDPLLNSLRQRVYYHVAKDSTVLDIACGTGDLAFKLAEKCRHVTGIDLYGPMVIYAGQKAEKENIDNTDFQIADASDLSRFSDDQFDTATMSLALHQFNSDERTLILAEALRVAPKLIIADYAQPIASMFLRSGVHVAERIAGKEHYRNFNSFRHEGGTEMIATKNDYRVSHSELSGSGVFSVIVIERG
ncbi:MAG TPA: class I SAM-dependent methyltransferase [Bacteroidales bacterium]|nr:class I SAM-dependent methyltransferase [Bacteroidales bacterium]